MDMSDFLKAVLSHVADEGKIAAPALGVALSAARIFAVLRVMPPLGGRMAPVSMLVVLSLALGFAMAGSAVDVVPPTSVIILLVLKEALVGLVIGLVASLPFYFMQQAGYLMDVSRGGAMSRLLSPTGDESATPLSNLFFFLCILMFFFTPAGVSFWMALETSFRAVPVYPLASFMPRPHAVLEVSVVTVGKLFFLSCMFALPVMLLVLAVDILVGVLGRFSPLGGSYFVSMPLRTAAGIGGAVLALLFAAPVMETILAGAIDAVGALFGR